MTNKPDWLIIKRPGSPVLFFICMATILAIGFQTDHNSCVRGQGVRAPLIAASNYFYRGSSSVMARSLLRATQDTGTIRQLDLKAAQAAKAIGESIRVHQLSCSFPFPSTH